MVAPTICPIRSPPPAINALNARLLDDYIADCEPLVGSWNRVIERHGIDFRLALPHRTFNRRQGAFSKLSVTPDGRVVDAADWARQRETFLPSNADLEYVLPLMKPRTAAGEFASWIAPPRNGVGGKPGDFEYVRIAA